MKKDSPLRQEHGQVVVAFVLLLVGLIGIAGLVIDVGHAYYTHRQLQASADAAALAGGQELPDASKAVATARLYGTGPGARNRVREFTPTEVVAARCLTSIPGCSPVNSVTVDEEAHVPTWFLRLLGVDSFRVHVRSTACSPCGARPVDVMLVLDRTGSMCQGPSGANDPACTDLNNAKNGIRTFLGYMDPTTQWVGLAVLPPAKTVATRCGTSDQTNYNLTSAAYTIVPLSKDFRIKGGPLNSSSDLITTLNCVQGGGTTSYANAIEAAQAELDKDGRPTVPDVVVFLTDGAANTGPTYYSTSSPYRTKPCHQGVTSANTLKARATLVYSIGYALDDDTGGCKSYTGSTESPAITVLSALTQIASTGNFYNRPDSGQLNTIYTQIAVDIAHGRSGLVDNGTQ